MDYLKYFEQAQGTLAVIGAVAVGLPALLHALVLFFKLIPGDSPDKFLEKLLAGSQKVADLVGKVFPKPKA